MEDLDKLQRYLDLIYRYLSIRNRTEKEIREYLLRKNAPLEIIASIISKLYEQKFLDDEKFARSWVAFRARLKPKGKFALKKELQQKGISKEIIEKIFSEENEELPDELTQATALVASRVKRLRSEKIQIIYQKAGGFLMRRGYSWDIAKKTIDSLLEKR